MIENKEKHCQVSAQKKSSLLRRLSIDKDEMFKYMKYYYKCLVERTGKEFVATEEVKENINRFVSIICDGNPIYGIKIAGTIGNGKTTLMNSFSCYMRYLCDKMQNSNTWTIEGNFCYRVNAQDIIDSYFENRNKFREYQNIDLLYIDDLGIEPYKVLEYGNETFPMYHLFRVRYERRLFTIVTTNLSKRAFCEKYDNRLVDRINQMYPPQYCIISNDKSFR